jgi:hypothetical protein
VDVITTPAADLVTQLRRHTTVHEEENGHTFAIWAHAGGVGMLDMIANRVAGGATVEFRPTGTSMVPLIRSRQLVTVAPVELARLEVGDIVLARVAGATYLHLVSAIEAGTGRVQISNNHGRVNGWTSGQRVYGICTAVDGVARPRLAGKVRLL